VQFPLDKIRDLVKEIRGRPPEQSNQIVSQGEPAGCLSHLLKGFNQQRKVQAKSKSSALLFNFFPNEY
jgi:hypothetical protein